MYIIAMFSLLKLRRTEPRLERPFNAPLYPILPLVALVIAMAAFVAMAWYNPIVFVIFITMLALGYAYFRATAHHRDAAPRDDMLGRQ